MYIKVIFTKANGRTVVELWRNGQRVKDVDQVIREEENEKDSGPTGRGDLLKTLRDSIRKGNKDQIFAIGKSTRGRTPRIDVVDGAADPNMAKMIKKLKESIDMENNEFLKSVFERVNGRWNGPIAISAILKWLTWYFTSQVNI